MIVRVVIAVAAVAFALRAASAQTIPDRVIVSPRKDFRIVSHYVQPEEFFVSRLHFCAARYPAVTFTRTSERLWRPFFYISPDDRWILQIRKTGSGENQGLLYRLDPGGP